MSLVLRENLARPLTHAELDSNFTYLNITEWVKKDYTKGQFVIRIVNNEIKLYYCLKTHTDFIYNASNNQFVEVFTENNITTRYWIEISGSGGGGGTVDDSYVTGATVSVQDNTVTLKLKNNKPDVVFDLTDIIQQSGSIFVVSGFTEAGDEGTRNIKQTLVLNNGNEITIDFVDAFTYSNQNLTKVSVGGVEQNSNIFASGLTLHEIIQKVFYPKIEPTINLSTLELVQTLNLNGNQLSLVEAGNIVKLMLYPNFNRGTSVVAGQPTKFMGLPTTYTFTGTNIAVPIIINGSIISYDVDNYLIQPGINTHNLTINYSTGEQPVYDDGTPYTEGNAVTFVNSGIISDSSSFEGVFAIFATTSNITELTKQNLVSMINGNNIEINLVAEINTDNRHTFEIPSVWLNSRPLQKIEYFNSFINQYDITDRLNQFDQIGITKNIFGNNINYVKFTHNGVLSGPRKIRLIF